MSETTSEKSMSIMRLILIPSVITLGVTLLRLIGELQHWPTALFNPAAGGAGAIVGIWWLSLIFGAYFALKLSEAGQGPEDRGRAVRLSLIGLVLFIGGGFIFAVPQLNLFVKVIAGIILLLLAIGLQYTGWPKLFKVLLAYGYAARIPVLIVMYIAMRGNWGTHYDVVPPNFPADTPFWPKFLQIAFLPQMVFWALPKKSLNCCKFLSTVSLQGRKKTFWARPVFWIAYTIITGMVCGSIAAAIKQRKNRTTQPASA